MQFWKMFANDRCLAQDSELTQGYCKVNKCIINIARFKTATHLRYPRIMKATCKGYLCFWLGHKIGDSKDTTDPTVSGSYKKVYTRCDGPKQRVKDK